VLSPFKSDAPMYTSSPDTKWMAIVTKGWMRSFAGSGIEVRDLVAITQITCLISHASLVVFTDGNLVACSPS